MDVDVQFMVTDAPSKAVIWSVCLTELPLIPPVRRKKKNACFMNLTRVLSFRESFHYFEIFLKKHFSKMYLPNVKIRMRESREEFIVSVSGLLEGGKIQRDPSGAQNSCLSDGSVGEQRLLVTR